MQRFARISAGLVAEIIELPDTVTDEAGVAHAFRLEDAYPESILADLVSCPDPAVVERWTCALDGEGRPTFGAPAPLALDPAQLAAVKVRAKASVDAAAERLRLSLITAGSGQAMEYQEAYAEAVQVEAAAKAGQALDAGAFPMLSASIGHGLDPQTGQPSVDLPGEARAVLAAYDAYRRDAAAIRCARLKGKAAIEAAATAEAIEAAYAAIAWPTLG